MFLTVFPSVISFIHTNSAFYDWTLFIKIIDNFYCIMQKYFYFYVFYLDSPIWNIPSNGTYLCVCVCSVLVAQSCLTPVDYCSPPGSSVRGVSQTSLLEWVAISFSRGSSWPRDWPWISCTACRFFTIWATREAPYYLKQGSSLWWSTDFGQFIRDEDLRKAQPIQNMYISTVHV